jgi:hypothetical protein
LRTIWTTFLALAALAWTATDEVRAVEAEYLRLRPHKQVTVCTSRSAKCPLVAAPRINKRRSTIPGVRNPDFGKPAVPILQPRSGSYGSPYRSFGGNRGITGGM